MARPGRMGREGREDGMNGFYEQAREKLAQELKTGSFDRYGQVMKQSVHDALLEFCRQDAEFAQAVAQGGKLEDCMKAVGKGIHGGGISDTEAYGAAVKFYFPGAEIRVTMQIDLIGAAAGGDLPAGDGGLLIDLSDFF